MKLPEIHYSQVESLGRHDTGGITALASAERQKGAVSQQAMQQLAGVAADYIARQENMEYNDQMAAMSVELSEWESKHNAKQFYTSDEIDGVSDDIPRMVTGSDDFGNEVSFPRNDIPAYEVYPQLLEQKLQGMIQEKSKKITNPHLRKDFINKSETVSAERVMRASIAAETAQQAFDLEKGTREAMKAADAGDLGTAKWRIDQLEINELEKETLYKDAEKLEEVYYVNNAIRSRDQEVILEMRHTLENPSYAGTLTDDQRRGAISDLNNQFDRLDKERDADRKNQHSMTVNGYAVGIMDGAVTRLDLDNAYALWQDDQNNPDGITPGEHSSLVGQLRASQRALKDVADYRGLVAGFLDGSAPADPADADHRKAIEWYVADQGLTRDNVVRMGDLAARTGIVPNLLKNVVNGYILNGDAEKAGIGMHYFNSLSGVAPHVLAGFSEETKKVGYLANIFMDGGQNAFAAVEVAREWHRDIDPAKEDYYKQLYRDAEVEPADDLHDLMNGDPLWDKTWYYGDNRSVDANPDMVASFQAMTKTLYPMTKGNLAMAQDIAYKSLQESWGISEVGKHIEGLESVAGKTTMKFPPERLLQTDGETVNKGLELYATEHGLDAGTLMLASDAGTQEDHSWVVISFDSEEGLFAADNPRFEGRKWVGKVAEGIRQDNKKKIELETYRRKARALVDEQAASGVQDMYP